MNPITIYYADDDQDDLSFFNDAIDKIKIDSNKEIYLNLYTSGVELSKHLKNNNTTNSIVFLDINMPCKSGFEILQEIKSELITKNLPVIMFSTSSDKMSVSKCQWLGATHYAIKPSNFSTLINILSRLIAIDWDNYNSDNEMFLIR